MKGFLRKKKKEQPDGIEQTEQAPVIDLIVRFDGRTNQVILAAIGGRLTPEIVYFLLDRARDWMRAQELAALGRGAPGSNGEGEGEREKGPAVQ